GHGDLRPGAARRALHRGDAVLDGEDLHEAAVHALVAIAPDLPRLDEDALAGGVQPALGLLEVGAPSDLGLQITNVGRRGGREHRRTGAGVLLDPAELLAHPHERYAQLLGGVVGEGGIAHDWPSLLRATEISRSRTS